MEPVKQIDTSAWKTYTNLDFDFEVKYPATWKWNWEFIDDMGKGGFTASNDKNIFSVDFSFSKSPDISKAQSMPITIAGQNLVRYTLDSFVPEKYLVIASKFNSKNYGENITLSLTCEKVENSEKEKTNCNNLFDQFASTFKFTK